MKIVQINTFPHKATGAIMLNIHRLLQEMGYESYVIWGRGREANPPYEYSINDNLGVKVHGLYTRLFDTTGFASWNATKKLISILEEIKPDIVHLHNLHGYYLNIQMLFEYLKGNKIEIVWTLHDCWPLTGHCAYFTAIGCNKWKTGCFACPQKKTYPASIFLDNSKKNWIEKKKLYSDLDMHIVTVSKWLQSIVEKSILNKYPCTTIYNGLDLEIFKPTQGEYKKANGFNEKHIILGVASEWTERKGLSDFIKLSNMLESDYIIVLVGLSKKQIELIKNTPIVGLSRTNSIDELVDLYSSADVFLNLSVEETMGMTTVEAMACGTPAIVYNCTALPEILCDLPDNIVEAHNYEAIKQAIYRVCSDKTDGLFYRELAYKYKASDKNAEYIDLYKSIFERE